MAETNAERAARWRAEEAAESAQPGYVFHLDGIAHYRDAETYCCRWDRPCVACGARLHFQGAYGGYMLKCEDCRADA